MEWAVVQTSEAFVSATYGGIHSMEGNPTGLIHEWHELVLEDGCNRLSMSEKCPGKNAVVFKSSARNHFSRPPVAVRSNAAFFASASSRILPCSAAAFQSPRSIASVRPGNSRCA